ncbi:MAG: hypothetical protein AB7H93_01260 [Vicinamibacterales bacterium]
MARHLAALPAARRSIRLASLTFAVLAGASPGWARQNGVDSGAPPAAHAAAGTTATARDLEALRDEIAELRSALAELRRELSALRPGAQTSAAPADAQPPSVPVEMLQSQVEQLAQEKVSSGSRFPVTLSGTILSNTVYNTGEANWLESPNLVGPTAGGSMTTTMRQSRVGLDVGAIPVGSWTARGTLILDFLGGTPGFVTGTVMGLPRMLYAFGRLERGGTAIEIGQDHVLLAPRDPTSLAAFAFPQFFRSGNLYLRAPQVRLEQTLGGFSLKAGIVAPVVGDAGPAYVFAPPAGAGERSERPAVEGHLGYDRGDADSAGEFHLGASGHYGWSRFGAGLVASSAGAVDFLARAGRIGLAGEAYTADDMDAYGAGVAQRGRSEGGWIEARLRASSRLSLTGGAGVDRRPDGLGQFGRLRNTSAFGNTILQLTPEVAVSLEYKWLQTRYGPVPVNRENHHVNAVFAVTF